MNIKINSTNSLRSDITKAVTAIKNMAETVEGKVEGEAVAVEKDVSRAVHSFTAVPLAIGTDITIRLDHAAGEVKRIVVQGGVTADALIAHIRSLV